MEDDLIFLVNGRRPESFQMEDNLNILVNGDNLNFIQKQIMQLKTIKVKTMVVAPLRVT